MFGFLNWLASVLHCGFLINENVQKLPFLNGLLVCCS